MRAEEQLKLAYMTIAELKDQNAKLVDAVAALERRLAESDGRDRRMVEEFFRGMIEDMRKAQEKQMSDLRESMQRTIDGLTAQISALAASGKVNTGKLYGRKSEKSSRLNRRMDDDGRNQGKDNFDGTAGSDKGYNTGSDDADCGELLRKALRYARAEWPAMKRVLESGDVEISNNISEQSVRKLKMNLRNAGNIGSESSAADNAFMYSVIESCKLNDIDPGKYISYLLGKLKTAREGEDLTGLLPYDCGL